MIDAHVHLDFMANGEEVARDAQSAGLELYACTVTPEGYAKARDRFGCFDNVKVGLGLHPWWVAGAGGEGDARQAAADQVDELLELLDEAPFVGEIGLDFGKRHAETRDAQLTAFSRIVQECAQRGGKTLSVHSVHAAREAIDVLENTGAAESCTCIFHWFTGPSDQLKRAIMLGCLFSVGPRMLATGKGREYVKAIPADRLLLETDYPPQQGQACSFEELFAELRRAAEGVAAIKPAPACDGF